jgi:hypothetical protein
MIKTTVRGRWVDAILVCDKCHDQINTFRADSLAKAEDGLNATDYKDQNRGHECLQCKKRREQAYDAWVTSPRDAL